MRVILDTHTFLWAITDEARLSTRVRNLMAAGECWFNTASVWELIAQSPVWQDVFTKTSGSFITSEHVKQRSPILSIALDHVLRVESLDLHHRDPFDRILVAQSIVENLPVLTVDPVFKSYPAKVIW